MPESNQKQNRISKRPSMLPDDAVLLIAEPEHEEDPAPYDIKPGYYNPKQMLQVIDQHKNNAAAIQFIADMLETGNPEDDGFAGMLRTSCNDPLAIARIVQICKEDARA